MGGIFQQDIVTRRVARNVRHLLEEHDNTDISQVQVRKYPFGSSSTTPLQLWDAMQLARFQIHKGVVC